MTRITVVTLMLLIAPISLLAENSAVISECEIIIDDFAHGIKPDWTTRSFKGTTEYTWTREDGRSYVRAISKNSASGLFYKIDYDPQQYPFITWQWKVDHIIAGGDALRESGDDYGARIYVVFPAFFFWNTRAINYIWANKLPKNEAVPYHSSANDMMVSVESGAAETGGWIVETRNVYQDFRRLFGEEPPDVGAIAIMTDTDNTGESASASYGPIAVCSRNPEK